MATTPSYVTATSRFARSYRAGAAVTASSQLSCGFTADGRLAIFVADSAGSVRAVTEDPVAASGWTRSDVLGSDLGGPVSLATAADGLHAIAFGRTAGPLLHTVLTPPGEGQPPRWPAFAPVPDANGWYEPCAARDLDGRFYAFFPDWGQRTIGGIFEQDGSWSLAFREPLTFDPSNLSIPAPVVADQPPGSAVIQVFFCDGEAAASWLRTEDGGGGEFGFPPVSHGVRQVVANGRSRAGVRHVFVSSNDGQLYDHYGPERSSDYGTSRIVPATWASRAVVAPRGADGVSVVMWEPENGRLTAFGMADSGAIAHPPVMLLTKVTSFFAGVDQAGTLEAFVVGNDGKADNRLIYLREDASQQSGWRVPVPIRSGVARMVGAYSPTGEPSLVVVTLDGHLLVLRRDETTGEWSSDEIEVDPADGTLPATEPFDAFITEVAVRTPSGAPAPRAAVSVTAATPVAARVQDLWRVLDPVEAVEVESDASGLLMIEMEADGIAAPRLSFTFPGPAGVAGAEMRWEPDTDVRATIADATTSGTALAGITLDDGQTHLLPDKWRSNGAADAIAKALHNCMNVGRPDDSGPLAGAGPRRQPTRRRLSPGVDEHRAVPKAVTGWRLSVRSGQPVFEELPPLHRGRSGLGAAAHRRGPRRRPCRPSGGGRRRVRLAGPRRRLG
jgi:hypothetical protein